MVQTNLMKEAIEAAIANVSRWFSYAGAGFLTFFSYLDASQMGMIAGVMIGFGSFMVTSYFNAKRDAREAQLAAIQGRKEAREAEEARLRAVRAAEEHEARMQALRRGSAFGHLIEPTGD